MPFAQQPALEHPTKKSRSACNQHMTHTL
jgi:hypothetical protein